MAGLSIRSIWFSVTLFLDAFILDFLYKNVKSLLFFDQLQDMDFIFTRRIPKNEKNTLPMKTMDVYHTRIYNWQLLLINQKISVQIGIALNKMRDLLSVKFLQCQ